MINHYCEIPPADPEKVRQANYNAMLGTALSIQKLLVHQPVKLDSKTNAKLETAVVGLKDAADRLHRTAADDEWELWPYYGGKYEDEVLGRLTNALHGVHNVLRCLVRGWRHGL